MDNVEILKVKNGFIVRPMRERDPYCSPFGIDVFVFNTPKALAKHLEKFYSPKKKKVSKKVKKK